MPCYSNMTCGSSYYGNADLENISPSTVSQDLNAVFGSPAIGSRIHVVFSSECSFSSHKNINVSPCKLDQASFAFPITTLDFSSLVSNTADYALAFNVPCQSASDSYASSSSSLFYSWSGKSITLKDSVLISNSYSDLTLILVISFSSCTFFDCTFTDGTSEDHSLSNIQYFLTKP